ncbi:pyridoxal-phosphate dependent enzyme [Candidatus Finniella inopinata]|uniref:Pyridoxal-phosphate dependent enzyme n=1 Tax=Candidatus Finniella inopinata TaxID=1696036 RepID=A0A4Q7DKI7_9PROT|nr:pyridoxal-phosphate dependent enzyme [Candidatus Finniella inopinata]RZI46900.1 pyridoxal-phosphate dependent enzyme [Candidatus Finniella inopinata]
MACKTSGLSGFDDFSNVTAQNILSVITKDKICEASDLIGRSVNRTPLLETPWLSQKIQGTVHLKLENMQVAGSCKARGVYLKLLSLTAEQKERGVITISTGNHALGVAHQAQLMGIKTTIVMPENTPFSKVESLRQYGVSVILQGKHMPQSRDFAMQLIKTHGYTMIHPFDDPYIITGQGTVGLEVMQQASNLDTLIVPVGGGAFAAGICIAAKAINPQIHIIGVQSEFCPATAEILFPNSMPTERCFATKSLAESMNVQFPGELALSVLAEHLDDCIVIPEKYIELAVGSLIDRSKIVAEGAGALGVACLLYAPELFHHKRVGAFISGGNIDAKDLATVLSKSHKDKGCLKRYQIETTDTPAILGQLSYIIGKAGGQIFELSQEKTLNNISAKKTSINAVIETRNTQHAYDVFQALVNGGFSAQMLEE